MPAILPVCLRHSICQAVTAKGCYPPCWRPSPRRPSISAGRLRIRPLGRPFPICLGMWRCKRNRFGPAGWPLAALPPITPAPCWVPRVPSAQQAEMRNGSPHVTRGPRTACADSQSPDHVPSIENGAGGTLSTSCGTAQIPHPEASLDGIRVQNPKRAVWYCTPS